MHRYLLLPILIILFLAPLHISAQDFESTLTITEARILSDIIGEDAEIPTISPDGLMIAYTNPEMQLCVIEIDSDSPACSGLPISFLEPFDDPYYVTPHRLVWSPDSTFIALHEPFIDSSNIWIYDTAATEFTRITETIVVDDMLDDFARWQYAPVWTHDSTALYYFDTYLDVEEEMTLDLYRHDFGTNEDELVYELSDIVLQHRIFLPVLTQEYYRSLSGTAALSPDGTKLAFILEEVSREDWNNVKHNIWYVDVEQVSDPQLVVTSEYLTTTMPNFNVYQFSPSSLSWTSDSSGIVTIATSISTFFFSLPYHIDITTGDVTPLLIDGETYTSDMAEPNNSRHRDYQSLNTLLINDELLMYNAYPIAIPATPQDVIEVDPAFLFETEWVSNDSLAVYPSMSADGRKVIMHNYLFTIDY